MGKKIFIGGLNYSTTEDSLKAEMSRFGEVVALRIVTDHETGKSRGFGFVTFDTSESAQKAIDNLDNQLFEGCRIGVKEAFEKKR